MLVERAMTHRALCHVKHPYLLPGGALAKSFTRQAKLKATITLSKTIAPPDMMVKMRSASTWTTDSRIALQSSLTSFTNFLPES